MVRAIGYALWLPLVAYAVFIVQRLVRAPGPDVVPPDRGSERFGVALAARQQLYARIVEHDPAWRRSAERFPDAWSQADDYHLHVATFINGLATQFHLRQTQMFLIYDEGLREGWTGPGGAKLQARWPRLVPRID